MPPGAVGRLQLWLQQVGFENGNPFAILGADQESRLLPEFFVDAGSFELIWGNDVWHQSALIFAPHGGGKSAYRLMIQHQCLPLKVDSDIIAVLYLPDEPLMTRVRRGEPVQTEDHISSILAQSLGTLLDSLAASEQLVAAVSEPDRSRLARLCRQFAPQSLNPEEVLARIRRCEPNFNPPWNLFRRSVREGALAQMVTDVGLPGSPIVQLFADLTRADDGPSGTPASVTRSLASLVSLLQNCGLRALCILVDRWDELHETAEKPAVLAQVLEPLLSDLHLMDAPGLVFKCFLPGSVLEPLQRYDSVRRDRLRVCEIRWSDDSLMEMLSKRLIAYSNGRIRSLAQISTTPLAEFIDQQIVRWAGGNPRSLLRFGALLLEKHVQHPGEIPLLITESAWQIARETFLSDHLPPLVLDPVVPQARVGKQRIELTPMEYKFLLVLQKSGGWAEKEELIVKVWGVGEGVSDQAVSRLVRRIREKVEPYPSDPVYLITEHSAGFRLRHVQIAPESEKRVGQVTSSHLF